MVICCTERVRIMIKMSAYSSHFHCLLGRVHGSGTARYRVQRYGSYQIVKHLPRHSANVEPPWQIVKVRIQNAIILFHSYSLNTVPDE